jgi:hypothetical protein
MPRWLQILFLLALGLAAGLVYGWVISPVEFVDTTPDTLRADYRADYVLMVAESFHADQDLELAARRLSSLGEEPPAEIVRQSLEFARQAGYSQPDLDLISALAQALQASGGLP